LVLACGLFSASAADSTQAPAPARQEAGPKAGPSAPRAASGGYYVDFRSIDGFLYGHAIIAYGRLNARGQPADTHYAGFEPEAGWAGLIAGHVGPVAGVVRTSKESANFAIVDSYRRTLSEQQYRKLLAAVETAKKKKYWNALAYNCLDFMADMAHAVGMRAPGNLVHPYVYIGVLRSMNESKPVASSRRPGE
jgi:hypothetical protein